MLSSINPVIATVRINIQAVTACRRNRFFRIILRKLPSPLPPLSKGGGLTAWHKPLLYSVLLAIPPPFLFTELFCRQDGGIALRQQNYFNRRNLQCLSATGGTWSGTLPQKTVTACNRDRLSANYRFVYSRRFTILQIAQTIPKAELSAATRRTAVSPRLANLKHFQRRNLERHVAAKKTATAYHRDRFILIIALFIPDRSLTSITHQPLKRSEFEAAHSRPLSRCRLLQRKYQRIASPMRKHRHNAPLYCPYIRLQESYLPSFHHLYRRQ